MRASTDSGMYSVITPVVRSALKSLSYVYTYTGITGLAWMRVSGLGIRMDHAGVLGFMGEGGFRCWGLGRYAA